MGPELAMRRVYNLGLDVHGRLFITDVPVVLRRIDVSRWYRPDPVTYRGVRAKG